MDQFAGKMGWEYGYNMDKLVDNGYGRRMEDEWETNGVDDEWSYRSNGSDHFAIQLRSSPMVTSPRPQGNLHMA